MLFLYITVRHLHGADDNRMSELRGWIFPAAGSEPNDLRLHLPPRRVLPRHRHEKMFGLQRGLSDLHRREQQQLSVMCERLLLSASCDYSDFLLNNLPERLLQKHNK